MPVALSYPGVYIQEIPSGVHTITGVATSIAAFIGRALRGPEDEPVTINSYGEFERVFGGLWADSSLGYAVRDFYLNGGAQAIIVRLYNKENGANAKILPAKLKIGAFTLAAASRGVWGQNLRATVDVAVAPDVVARMGLAVGEVFNLTVQEVDANGQVLAREIFRNLSVKDSPRQIKKVLGAQSALVRWDGDFPANPLPAVPTTDPLVAADDDVTKASKALAGTKAANPPVPADITKAQKALDDANAAMSASNGIPLTKADNFTPDGAQGIKKGMFALERADMFNIMCIPPYLASGDVDAALLSDAASYCEARRAMLLVDPPSAWTSKTAARDSFVASSGPVGIRSKNAAIYFPRLRQPNPLRDNQMEEFVPCGAVAGIFARTDASRGVWKAPAGLQATLAGVSDVNVPLTDAENGELNQLGINCLRAFPAAGKVVWGSRTLRGADQLADENKYIPVRRTTLFIEESLYRGLQWAVFEPNDEPLWSQIRLNAGAFMQNLFRQGAFQGSTPRDAYFVKCDRETTTQADINLGVVNVLIGFAPLKPAEFVVISIQQMAGQIAV